VKTANFNIRLDPAVKSEAEKAFAAFGLNLSEAINMFLHKSIMVKGLPFDVRMETPNDMLRASFEEAEAMLKNPNLKGYTTVEELNAAMDAEDAEEGFDV
jgi:DNA-damage-inducible protein J